MGSIKTAEIPCTLVNFDNVYEPAEDSFLLIDALEKDIQIIKDSKPLKCLEIGTGSGVIIISLAKFFRTQNYPLYFVGSDINPFACKVTKQMSQINKTDIEVIQMDSTSCLTDGTNFDIIIFNPPYVVTDYDEINDEKLLSKAWAGGQKGREVMDKLFPKIEHLLSAHGLFYLLVIKENNPQDIINEFKKYYMRGTIVIDRKIRGEHLHVLRFWKNNNKIMTKN